MTIFISNLKRILKKRINRIMLLAVPFVVVLLAFSTNTGKITINVGIVDKDNTKFTEAFINGLKEKGDVEIVSEQDMKSSIMNKTLAYGIIIDKGFTEAILSNQDKKLETFKLDEVNITSGIELYIENFMNAAKNIASNTDGNQNLFYSTLNMYNKGDFKSNLITFGSKGGDGFKEKTALGLIGYAMLVIATFATNIILEDKKNGTYIRMFATPLNNISYMLQNILSFIVIVLIQVYIAFEIMKQIFHAQLGASESNMFILFVIYTTTCVALSLAITSVSKNVKQASAIGVLVNTLVAMLGGLFWPKEYMPDILISIGKFTPAYWLTDGINKLLTSSSLASVMQDIGILMLFTLVFFLMSSWGKVYCENV